MLHILSLKYLFIAANYKLQSQIDGRKNADTESQTRIQSLTKEKDELLDLAMQRGKIIQVGMGAKLYR